MQFNPVKNLTTDKTLQCLSDTTGSHEIYRFTIKGTLTDVGPGNLLDYHGTILLALRPHPHLKNRHYYLEAAKLNRSAIISRYTDVESDAFGRGKELLEVESGVPCYVKSLPEGKYELLMPPVEVKINDRIEIVDGDLLHVTGLINVEEGVRVKAIQVTCLN